MNQGRLTAPTWLLCTNWAKVASRSRDESATPPPPCPYFYPRNHAPTLLRVFVLDTHAVAWFYPPISPRYHAATELEDGMNVDNILKVAEAIERHSIPDLGFNMSRWRATGALDLSGHSCGTTGCIAGWAAALHGVTQMENIERFATNLFDLDRETALRLFLVAGFGDHIDPVAKERNGVTSAQAVRALRILAITGKVDWAGAMNPAEPTLPALPVNAKTNVSA